MSRNVIVIGAVLSTLCLAFPAHAGGQNVKNKSVVATNSKPVLAALALANRLADYGHANKDAIALVEAARIRQRVGGRKIVRTSGKQGSAPQAVPRKRRKRRRAVDSVQSLLKAARRVSNGSQIVEALIRDVEGRKSKGHASGPQYSFEKVDAKKVATFTEKFNSGELAEVVVSGDGATDLDLYVYDAGGNQICKDEDRSDKSYCHWYPKSTASFEIRIRNRGEVFGKYVLTTN